MKIFLLVGFTFVCFFQIYARSADPVRNFTIDASQKVHQLDSLSIVEETFSVTLPDGQPLPKPFYSLDPWSAVLTLNLPPDFPHEQIMVSYEVWPLNFSQSLFLKDSSSINMPGPGQSLVLSDIQTGGDNAGVFDFEGINSSGSIVRGLTLGNRQDAALNSAMNLQLSGKLSEDFSILAVVSDQNVPFQPDGTTQQIQDFDKVFIQVFNENTDLIAGDFDIEKPKGHFLNITKRARGAKAGFQWSRTDSLNNVQENFFNSTAAAISRGKYSRFAFTGMEGNQGPYKLRGADNETFIIIISGSERVFLDGRILERGMEKDYIINYNTAEISFTPQNIINQYSRIVVEFEYAERNYVRSMVFTENLWQKEKVSFFMNFFSEQDHPNQTLFQELSENEKDIMALAGDSLHDALAWNVDSTGFQNDRIMYQLTDTLGFDSVFVYSKNPDKAFYQPRFSYVGEGNGNYVAIRSDANGQVYQWIEPVNDNPRGAYEPVVLLTTPKRKQLLTMGAAYKFTPKTFLEFEYALSRNDLNLFSELHNNDNAGHAVKLVAKDIRGKQDDMSWSLISEIFYEFRDENFETPERYRSIEFERDWNVEDQQMKYQEHLPGFALGLEKKGLTKTNYTFTSLIRPSAYTGMMHQLSSLISNSENLLDYKGSLLQTNGYKESTFYRHDATLARSIWFFKTGVRSQWENNKIFVPDSLVLATNSHWFHETEFFVTNPDTSSVQYKLFYRTRTDYLPDREVFAENNHAGDYGFNFQYIPNTVHQWKVDFVYRTIHSNSELTPNQNSSKAINSRIDYQTRINQGVLHSRLFYESSGSMERQMEFRYVEVPAGQGLYIWNDYNNNSIQELDEFEISPFPEEANFIRVFIPGNEFTPTYRSTVNHSVVLNPAVLWREEKGWRGIAGKFHNRLNYRIEKKVQSLPNAESMNPFAVDPSDTSLVALNSDIRNSVMFNRNNAVYTFEYTVHQNRTKSLMSNGFEFRERFTNIWRGRVNLNRFLGFDFDVQHGAKSSESAFFLQRNFNIDFQNYQAGVTCQMNRNVRFKLEAGYNQQKNSGDYGGQKADIWNTQIQSRLGFPGQGRMEIRYRLSQIHYPFAQNTPVAFEMLQALKNGINHLWHFNWQHNINQYLQLNINYNGRKPPDVAAIHTGTVSLRALF
ncbi:MAG: hypothetical protein ACLFQS_08060 [Bacteroidales bacterium]